MATTERKTASRIEPWSSWFYKIVLHTVLLVLLVDGVYSSVIGRILQGKLGESERLFSIGYFGFVSACFGVALIVACLPRLVRYALQGAIGGAFVGYVVAMIYVHIRNGWGPIDWGSFRAGIREGGVFIIPLAAALGLLLGWGAYALSPRQKPKASN
jgi:hypothetical protein